MEQDSLILPILVMAEYNPNLFLILNEVGPFISPCYSMLLFYNPFVGA